MEQRSDAWHEERRGAINASEAGALLGISPYKTASAARREWLGRKRGNPGKDLSGLPDIERGVRLEPAILDKLEQQIGCVIQQDGGREWNDIFRASADGYCDLNGENMVVEVKAPRNPFDPLARPDYLLQMLLQCHAYEAKMAIFAQGFEDGTVTSWEFPIERLHELVSEAVSGDPVWLLQELFAEMMAEPEIDEEWLDLEGQYAIAKQAVDQAKEALDEIADKMKAGGAREGARYSVIQQTRQGSVDMKKLAAEHPEVDLDQFRKKQMTFMSIREVKA